jgi:hypothetical protein
MMMVDIDDDGGQELVALNCPIPPALGRNRSSE